MVTKKKRTRVWTSEDRAAHRVFEKSRREAFNDSLIDLARRVPSLAGTRRLNKHLIVNHSIARLHSQRQLCLSAANELSHLIHERDELLAEVNQWRSASGAPFTPRQARPVGKHLQTLMNAGNETFGTFPNGFGDNPTDCCSPDDQEQDEVGLDEVYSNSHEFRPPRVQNDELMTTPAESDAEATTAPYQTAFTFDNLPYFDGQEGFDLLSSATMGQQQLGFSPATVEPLVHSQILSGNIAGPEMHSHEHSGLGFQYTQNVQIPIDTFTGIDVPPNLYDLYNDLTNTSQRPFPT